MKKFLSIIMVALLAVSMTACETNSKSGDEDNSSKISTTRGPAVRSDVESESSDTEPVASKSTDTETDTDSSKETDTDSGKGTDSDSKKDSDSASSKKENTSSKSEVKLSDKLSDFTIEIDGTVYQFPMKVTDLMALGWELDSYNTFDENLDANTYYNAYFENKNDTEISFYVMNFAKSSLPFEDTYVAGLNIYNYELEEDERGLINMPKDIKIGEATVDDVKKAYGTPDDSFETEDSDYITMTYTEDYFVCTEFTFRDGVLSGIRMQNFVAPDDFEEPELRDEIPASVTDYKAPKKLGSDIQSGIIELGGKLYQMPVPLEQLLNDGWKIDYDDDVTETVGSGDYVFINLEKGDIDFDGVTVYNDADYEVPIEYASVKVLDIYGYGDESLPIKFPGNITPELNLDEFKKAVKDMDYETKNGDGYVVYTFEMPTQGEGEYYENYLKFQYNTDTKELIHIELYMLY